MVVDTIALLASDDSVTSVRNRGLGLIALMVGMFALAGVAVVVGRLRQRSRNASDLSVLTGVARGANSAGDAPKHSADWYEQTMASGPAQPTGPRWQDVILDEGNGADTPVARHARRDDTPNQPTYQMPTRPAMPETPTASMSVPPVMPPASTATPIAGGVAWGGGEDEGDTDSDWWQAALAADDN